MKNPIPDLNKGCIVYKFNCFCEEAILDKLQGISKPESGNIYLDARYLFIEEEPEIKTTATKNSAKRSSIAEHLINNRDCARKYEISKSRPKFYWRLRFFRLRLTDWLVLIITKFDHITSFHGLSLPKVCGLMIQVVWFKIKSLN